MTIDTIYPIDAISKNARCESYMRQLLRNGKGCTLCTALNHFFITCILVLDFRVTAVPSHLIGGSQHNYLIVNPT